IQTATSSPVRTIDFSPATALQLTTDGAGGTSAIGDWAAAGTDIVTYCKKVRQYVAKTFGFRLTDVYYGINLPGYLSKNTSFKEYLSRFQGFRDAFVSTGEIPDGVLGFNWHPADMATVVNGGTATTWASDDFLAFSPDPADTGWYEYFECGLPCPTGLTSEKAIESAMLSPESLAAAFQTKFGVHSYTTYSADPPSAKLVCADYALPVIKNPNVMPRGVCH
ncbi:MAG: hypothetical protein JWO31_1189, partial [Phycisphaerales bacterium]|nr:hypothetical protein [Phycisphaerales bacterium]